MCLSAQTEFPPVHLRTRWVLVPLEEAVERQQQQSWYLGHATMTKTLDSKTIKVVFNILIRLHYVISLFNGQEHSLQNRY